jgi:hypothetical protein
MSGTNRESSAARLTKRQIGYFRVLDTFSFPPKQVPVHFFSRSRLAHHPVLSSYHDDPYKPNMGVHRPPTLPQRRIASGVCSSSCSDFVIY